MCSGVASVPDNGTTAANVDIPKEPAKTDQDGNLSELLHSFSGFFDLSNPPSPKTGFH